MPGQLGFFDLEDRYAQLSKAGDPLEKLASVVDFEPFRYRLLKALKRSDGAKGGRPPYDPMFGTLRTNGEITVQDFDPSSALWDVRRSGRVPDPRPVDVHPLSRAWARRRGAGCQDNLAVPRAPHQGGCRRDAVRSVRHAASGQGLPGDVRAELDASLIPAPRQHLDDGEKAAIKEGKSTAEIWPDEPAKAAQKTSMPVGRSSIPGPSRLQRARRPSPTSPFRCSGTRTISASIDATGLSVPGW